MFDYEVVDCRLQYFLKNQIMSRGRDLEHQLKHLMNCGTYGDLRLGVHLLSNGTHSKILGIRTCNSPWVCPYCTARTMSKYAAKIESAIQAIDAKEKRVPIMTTLTVFHTCEYSVGEMLDLLTKAYSFFNKMTGYSKKNAAGVIYKGNGAADFFNEFGIKHKVKACEITFGEHGWHPHYHILYFVDPADLEKIGAWESKLVAIWNKCVCKAFLELFPERWASWNYLFKKYSADEYKTHKGFYFTKDSNGNVCKVSSAQYCCGFDIHWDSSKELTGGSTNLKIANPGHYTPRQLLEKAYDGDQKALDRYLELCVALKQRRQHRVEFSRTGIRAIIIEWMNSQGYKEYIKKKNTAILSRQKIAPFYTVCWFTSRQWLRICNINLVSPIIFLIRRFAVVEDVEFAFQLICELMQTFNLTLPARYPPFDIAQAYNELIHGEFESEDFNITALNVWKKSFSFKPAPELVPFDLGALRVKWSA